MGKNENTEKRMIPYGIDFSKLPKEEPDCKAIIPVHHSTAIASIPSKPRSYGCTYFAQPKLAAPPAPLLLEGPSKKDPVVALPAGTKLQTLKDNEVLLGVKTNESGEIVCAKYAVGERTVIEGVRAHPSKVKFIPPKEAPKHAMAAEEMPRKRRKTVADLEMKVDGHREIVTSLEACQRVQSRCITHTDKRLRDLETVVAALEKKIKALEILL